MSKQRKHIEDEILHQFPEPNEKERVVLVVEAKGRNILEVEYDDHSRVLVLIPAKYHKKVWIKNGNFVIVEPTVLPNSTNKVVAVVTHPFLTPEDIQYLVDTDQWPSTFLPYVQENHGVTIKPDAPNSQNSAYVDMDFMSDDDSDEWGHNPNYNREIADSDSSSEE